MRVGVWPSGKASVFGIVYRRFESSHPSQLLSFSAIKSNTLDIYAFLAIILATLELFDMTKCEEKYLDNAVVALGNIKEKIPSNFRIKMDSERSILSL